MPEYIEREAALQAMLDKSAEYGIELQKCGKHMTRKEGNTFRRDYDAIKKTPAADVAPVIHARWVPLKNPTAGAKFICSFCKRPLLGYPKEAAPYCHCGAKMKEETK